ncbi:hypothetical protein EYB25_005547 [Talaromyces marneffei]|uniref:uncharacterized protein n=1 Tax=Talaromyces marneffei TaxID=37727 RepID=UPI0012AA0B8D|nr:uncharacterized protein EYB26_007161 [Talaromyces marneffei]KAE8551657.1 hypothetical protein EYB25_005547 [Talaromyces marneffei]QGA19472.1 hypothetical protein EYB26_007161 [Talaromyces marneffei]
MAESDPPIPDLSDHAESPSRVIGRRRNRLVNIIKQNDLNQLRQFIASYPPEDVIAPGTPYLEDILFHAASYGSPEALEILLEVYAAAPEIVKGFNPKFNLLIDACAAANVDVVRFILDRHGSPENRLPLGTVDLHQRDNSGDTPIIAAAGSLECFVRNTDEEDKTEWVQNRISRGHRLIYLLLDWGCSATDVVPPVPNDISPGGSQVRDSVLGVAVSRANGPLIQRLIDSGADIYLKHQHFYPFQLSLTKDHIINIIKTIPTLIWLPLVTVMGDSHYIGQLTAPEIQIVDSWISSLELQRPFDCFLTMILLGLILLTTLDPRRCTMLLWLMLGAAVASMLSLLSALYSILDLILSHGANINHAENNGRTPLHVFARNLRQVSAAKFLITHGAGFRAQDSVRETSFHAAARGFLIDHVCRSGRYEQMTTANRIRLQDEMMRALQEAAAEDTAMLTSQPNAEGKTPQDLLEETRNRWYGSDQHINPGRGRGQPVHVGA